ncbi:MAG: hypothetical protein HKN64_07320 [Woeseiaceae bacterium]|nr:hypothetical protein [Woeseiaceae bacterium]
MIRLAGILTGSAVAVAFLFVALGFPEFNVEPAATTPLPVAQHDVPPRDPEPAAVVEAIDESPAQAEAVAASEPPVQDVIPPAATLEIEDVPVPLEPRETSPPVSTPPATEPQWYAFWSPFRSELAAEGFVAELQRTTGLDYRVVKLKPGVYEVAFAYVSDEDVENKLARISSATGLDLSGG